MDPVPNIPDDVPRLSRSLLTPGPQPPLSHFGVTLLRHVVFTGLRYSFYQLGMPMPESPPVRILHLRLFLDAKPLLLTVGEGRIEVVAAMQCPAGVGMTPDALGGVGTAAAVHRRRLRLFGPRRARGGAVEIEGGREELWAAFADHLKHRQPHLSDLVLWEIVETLLRRRRRREGIRVEPALGRQAWRQRRGESSELAALGPLDPLEPAWDQAETIPSPDCETLGPLPARASGRGSFREGYRRFLSEGREVLCELGRRLADQDALASPDDVFFLPFDLGEELGAEEPKDWLGAATAANRREYEGIAALPEHPDEISRSPDDVECGDRSGRWLVAPLLGVG